MRFNSAAGQTTNSGFAEAQNGSHSGGTGNELDVNNVSIGFAFPTVLMGLSMRFGEFGGNLNLRINGDFANFDNFADINGKIIGGVLVSVVNGFGNDFGMLVDSGSITDFEVGGQELYIDEICPITCMNG